MSSDLLVTQVRKLQEVDAELEQLLQKPFHDFHKMLTGLLMDFQTGDRDKVRQARTVTVYMLERLLDLDRYVEEPLGRTRWQKLLEKALEVVERDASIKHRSSGPMSNLAVVLPTADMSLDILLPMTPELLFPGLKLPVPERKFQPGTKGLRLIQGS